MVLSGRTTEALQEHIKILLFKVSNNLMADELNPLLNIVELSGLMENPLQLSDDDLTMRAFSEKLFQICFRKLSWGGSWRGEENDDERAVRFALWLLKSGQSPNTIIKIDNEKTTALQISLRFEMDHLATSILNEDAHPDAYFVPGNQVGKASIRGSDSYWMHPPFYAISSAYKSGNRDAIERLMEAGASLDWCLASIERCDSGDSLLSSVGPLALFIHDASRTDAMVIALLEFVVERAITGPGLTKAILKFAELGLAVSEAGRKDVLAFLLDRGVVNATSGIGGTALHAPARRGRVDICRLLLNRGALVGCPDTGIPSPLHLACYEHHLDAVQLLHAHGVSVRRSLDVTEESAQISVHRFFRHKIFRQQHLLRVPGTTHTTIGCSSVQETKNRSWLDRLPTARRGRNTRLVAFLRD